MSNPDDQVDPPPSMDPNKQKRRTDKEYKLAKRIQYSVHLIDMFVLRYVWILVVIALISSQLLSNYTENFAFIAAFLWKAGGIAIGAWLGNLVFIKYFCFHRDQADDCTVNDTHKMYFILGVCAIFGLRF